MYAFADIQTKSDWVMAEYARKAALPLAPINPQKPPYVQAAPEGGKRDFEVGHGRAAYRKDHRTVCVTIAVDRARRGGSGALHSQSALARLNSRSRGVGFWGQYAV